MNYSRCLQLLRNPVPCPVTTARSRCWAGPRRGTRDRTDRGGEEEQHSQSLETVTDWNHRLPTRSVDTPKTLTDTFSFHHHSCSFAQKHGQTRTSDGAVHYSSWGHGGYVGLEHLYPSLAPSLSDYIMSHTTPTQFISLWLSILHLGTHHTSLRLPSRILCKTTCAALKML